MPAFRPANAIMYIDAGYLWLTLQELTGKANRQQLGIDQVALIRLIGELAQRHHPEVRVLRQMWYDAEPDNGTPIMHHQLIRDTPGACLRTGTLYFVDGLPRQKGVDTRLVADIVTAALKGAAAEVILFAGDADLIPALEAAGTEGVRTGLWYLDGGDTVSRRLKGAADHVLALDPQIFLDLQYRGRPAEGAAIDFSVSEHPPGDHAEHTPAPNATRAVHHAAAATERPDETVESAEPAPEVQPEEANSAAHHTAPASPPGQAPADAEAEAVSSPIPSPVAMPRFIPRKRAVKETDLIPLSVLSRVGAQLVVDTQGEARRIGERYAQRWWDASSKEQRARIIQFLAGTPQVPQRVDSDMLHLACAAMDVEFVPEEARIALRDGFLAEMKMRVRQS
ncbi:NYN domain-containing protein [Hoyosella sp. YIM 151337]|uniref:NYN domain-containing protein n=1 Tax=Hoyosella sp. YIM 151337 TaxID=2992742 RepID=UPI0022354929|nr:NYN domain-containing protein [Hoyosella sp. YIM 151337]MCW4353878.1 NYN domain-containing protein [Hoyosella sp. YIM 151337]